MMRSSVFNAIIVQLLSMALAGPAAAAPPQLYRQAAYESPVRGDPDDLLLLAGYGFAADDIVVYRVVPVDAPPAANSRVAAPDRVPTESDADSGVADIVSAADIPYSLTIRLPPVIRADQSYELWVRTVGGEWSKPVKINDARPFWMSPAYVYASSMPAGLPRELKIVGRNLRPSPTHATLVEFTGPEHFTGTALSDGPTSRALDDYVARVPLPTHLMPGHYRVSVSRDGVHWEDLAGQPLEVLSSPRKPLVFTPGDARVGGCRPDDGQDDTACIVRAIAAAAHAGGGAVDFGPGTWDLIDSKQPGLSGDEGILVPAGVQLRGAGSARTRVLRHSQWNASAATAAFTLTGHTLVTGFTFADAQIYQPSDHTGPYLQVGENWERVASALGTSDAPAQVTDVTIVRNTFDKPQVAIGGGGLPIDKLFVTYNIFGAYHSAIELSGDQYNMVSKYRIDDSVVDYNVFKPGSELDLARKSGTIASELGAGRRVDFSGNTADGASTDYLYSPTDPKGWRAAFFWNLNNDVEQVLVSQNATTCTGDKIGDGEAISFDNNTNTFAFSAAVAVTRATADGVTVPASPTARQNHRDVPIEDYYVGHWVQIVSGPGLGQVRKITGYSINESTGLTTLNVAPAWDVPPKPGETRITVGREYWQLYVIDNRVDNRKPLCQKNNRSRLAAGTVGLWGQSADTVFAGNHQYDSDGILVQQVYGAAEHSCPDCTMMGFFTSFLEIRDNVIDGEYDWSNDCSRSGISIGVGAAPWGDAPPPTVGFGVSISHNSIRHADAQYGGAIAQVNTWGNGPEPQRWPLSDNLLIQHNSISEIDGARAVPICGSSRPRVGIAFPDPAIAWRTVLYANSCARVSTPIGPGGIDTVKVCPSSAANSCECAPNTHGLEPTQ